MSECPAEFLIERLAEDALDRPLASSILAHCQVCGPCREALTRARADAGLLTDIRRIIDDAASAVVSRTLGVAGPSPGGPPARIAGYELIRLIGEGATAAVYEALQPLPRRAVAIKLLRNWESASAGRRELFDREAHALARLAHPNIAAVYAAGLSETGQPYIAMELVRGKPLHAHWRDAGLDARARVELIATVCDAVQHAHDRGVFHRDLKPSNVMVDDSGHAKVLDFGLARIAAVGLAADGLPTVEAGPTLYSGSGGLLGTLAFMAPEQTRGEAAAIDHRCDIYALGAMLYVALTDQLPLPLVGLSVREAAASVCERMPAPPSAISPESPRQLDAIVLRAMAKCPDDRHATAAALASDLRVWLAGGSPPRNTARRSTAISTLAVGAVSVLALIWWTTGGSKLPSSPTRAEAINVPAAGLVLDPGWRLERPPDEERAFQRIQLKDASSDAERLDANIRLGLLHEAAGDHRSAAEHFTEVLRLHGDAPDPHDLCRLARALTELGRLAEAAAALDEARSIVRRVPPAHLIHERFELAQSTALLDLRRGNPDSARAQLYRAQQLGRNFTSEDDRRWAAWLSGRVAQAGQTV